MSIALSNNTFEITTNHDIHYSKTIIISAGNGSFQPKKLSFKDSKVSDWENLHYFITDLNKFADKKVLVFGGGDSAVDWSLMLESIAKEVTLVHRRNEFRAHENSVENLKNSTVQIETPFVPVGPLGENRIEQVILENVKELNQLAVDVDDVIVNYGFASSLGPIKNWGLALEKNSIVVNSKMETNIPGIFAVGDICTYDGKVNLIATGFGEAPIAVSSAKMHIDPNATTQTVHSTTLMNQLTK